MLAEERLERRNYRKVYNRLWKSPTFRALPGPLKLMTLYVLTGPQTNRVGLYQFSFGRASEDMGVPLDTAGALKVDLEAVCAAFTWRFDDLAQVIWIPSWWVFNPANENTNNMKGYLSDLTDMPRTALIHPFCRNLRDVPVGLHPLFAPWEALLAPAVCEQCSNGVGNSVRTTETETETETETNTETETHTHTALRPQRGRVSDGFEQFWTAYPKKKAKDDARRAWNKRRPDGALLLTILSAIASQCHAPEWTREAGRYIPYPATWLNRGQWTDGPSLLSPVALTVVSDRTRANLLARDAVMEKLKAGGGGP